MALPASDVVTSARGTLIDAAKVTWSDAELIAYLNEAIQKTCFVKPDAFILFSEQTLSVGVVQGFDVDTNALIDIPKNTASGKGITQVDKALLEAADPNWAATAGALDVEHYMVDPRSPRSFYVYPPAIMGTSVTILKAVRPASLVNLSDEIPTVEASAPILIDYVLARAYAKNSKKQDLTKSSYHMQQWAAALGLNAQTQVADTPKIADGTPT